MSDWRIPRREAWVAFIFCVIVLLRCLVLVLQDGWSALFFGSFDIDHDATGGSIQLLLIAIAAFIIASAIGIAMVMDRKGRR